MDDYYDRDHERWTTGLDSFGAVGGQSSREECGCSSLYCLLHLQCRFLPRCQSQMHANMHNHTLVIVIAVRREISRPAVLPRQSLSGRG